MDLKERIKVRITELEKAENEHREHNRILYANQSKLIRWELQGLLSDDREGKSTDESKALPIQNVRQRYFVVAYRASSDRGMLDGQINITVKGLFMERWRVLEIIKEHNKMVKDIVITNFIELTEEEHECWVGNDA